MLRKLFFVDFTLAIFAVGLLVSVAKVRALAQGEAAFAGVELTIPDETVPPGGMLQLKVQITEPRPILKGGQKARYAAPFLGPVQGIALSSPSGDASGTAILSKGTAQFSLSSPLADMGNVVDYPILTMAMPVKATATRGSMASLVLDPSISQWVNPKGENYPVLLKNGILTVGGTLSISNVVPGGGVIPAGTKIAILGVGFQSNSKIQVNEAVIAKKTFLSTNEIDITLTKAVNMTSRRIRVINPSTNERATYFSYQRTTAMGKSTHPLIAATVPLFATKTWTTAFFRPVLNASQFSGIALENPTAGSVTVKLQLLATNGNVLATRSVTLLNNKLFTRDLVELFTGATPGAGTRLKVTSNTPIPMLGLLGDDGLRTVDPVAPSAK